MRYPNIEAEKARKGFSWDDLSRIFGVSRKTIYNWINTGNIPQRKLVEMSQLFGCSIDYLLESPLGLDNADVDAISALYSDHKKRNE